MRSMPHFSVYENSYTSDERELFEQAYEDACRRLGINPASGDDSIYRSLRDDLAKAIMNAARFGERDSANLTAVAISVALRNWHLPGIEVPCLNAAKCSQATRDGGVAIVSSTASRGE
jgi:hypothetical protein